MIRIIIHIRLTEFPFLRKKEWYPSSQPLAAQASLRYFKKGGSAIDAAIATAAKPHRIRARVKWNWRRCVCACLDK